MDQLPIEEKVARELLNYFTGKHPTGVKYEDQAQEVKDLWLGAARVAIKTVQGFHCETANQTETKSIT